MRIVSVMAGIALSFVLGGALLAGQQDHSSARLSLQSASAGLSLQNPQPPNPAPPASPTPPPNPTPPAEPGPPPASPPDPSQPFYGESSPRVTVVRDDKTITAIKYGPDDKGLAIICPPKDDDPDQLIQTVYYDVEPWSVHITIDKNLIKTQIAFVEAKDGGDGRIEAYNGVATESSDPDRCLPDLKPDPKPGTVRVEQGKTRLTGSRLDYDRSTGIAVVDGPIVFERPQERENDTLKGSSDSIQIFVDDEKTVLEGKVTLSSKCRTSRAERVEYDDTKNRAILFGNPAVSQQNDGKGQIQGAELEYDLETNDVIVVAPYGGVSGSFDDTAEPCK